MTAPVFASIDHLRDAASRVLGIPLLSVDPGGPVYLYIANAGPILKIGHSKDPHRRMLMLNSDRPSEGTGRTRLVAAVPFCSRRTESEVHSALLGGNCHERSTFGHHHEWYPADGIAGQFLRALLEEAAK